MRSGPPPMSSRSQPLSLPHRQRIFRPKLLHGALFFSELPALGKPQSVKPAPWLSSQLNLEPPIVPLGLRVWLIASPNFPRAGWKKPTRQPGASGVCVCTRCSRECLMGQSRPGRQDPPGLRKTDLWGASCPLSLLPTAPMGLPPLPALVSQGQDEETERRRLMVTS